MMARRPWLVEGGHKGKIAIPDRITRLAKLTIVTAVSLAAGCGAPPREERRPSEPTDAFYTRAPGDDGVYPPIRWQRRHPQHTIVTKLRPTMLKGRFPTSYLRSITHLDQPYAKTIWDVATAGISLADLTPLPVEKSTPWRRDFAPDDLVLEIGGYSSSSTMTPEQLVGIVGGRVERSSRATVVREKRLVHYFFPDDLSGMPNNYHVLRCYDVCSGILTLPMSAASKPSLGMTINPESVTGLAVRVSFDVSQILRWDKVKQTAVCFSTNAIADFDVRKLVRGGSAACAAMQEAVVGLRTRTVKHGRPDG